MSKPYLSIVTTARNDNHGGDLLARIGIFFKSLFFNLEGKNFNCEIVVVDWNPPYGEKRLAEVLNLENIPKNCEIVFVEVPKVVHDKYKYADKLPLYQMIGKNVGIRRSTGKFVLSTNIDLIFSEEIFDFFEEKKLEKGKIYRAIRIDVDKIDYEQISAENLVETCKNHVIRKNYIDGTTDLFGNLLSVVYFPEEIKADNRNFEKEMPRLFTNASGDFQLMHIDDWNNINGYPELDLYSMHLDSMLEYIAYFAGLEEVIFNEKKCSYHIEHDNGFTPEAQNKGEFDTRYKKRQIGKLDFEEVRQYAYLMKNRGGFFNEYPNWGLKNKYLPIYKYYKNRGSFTIICTPKPFVEKNSISQKNAIKSWMALNPTPEIIILGDEEGYEEVVNEFGLKWIKDIEKNSFNTPLVSSIFEKGSREALNDTVVYINSDIIILDDFIESIRNLWMYNLDKYLMIGERTNLDLDEKINFSNFDTVKKLKEFAKNNGVSQGTRGIDYFIFNKNQFVNIPDFALGRTVWDHWLIWKSFDENIPVINATESIFCIHQNHNYGHLKGGYSEAWFGEEAKINSKLANGRLHRRHIVHSNFKLKNGEIFSVFDENIKVNMHLDLILDEKFDNSNSENIVDDILSLNTEILRYNQEKVMIIADKLMLEEKFEEAYKLYHYLTFIDNGDAIINVTHMSTMGLGVKQDYRVSNFYWEKVSNLETVSGNNTYGIIFENFDKGITPLHYWMDRYEKGDKALASFILTMTFLYGLGEKKDIPESMFWLKRSVDAGNFDGVHICRHIFKKPNIDIESKKLFIHLLYSLLDQGISKVSEILIEVLFELEDIDHEEISKLLDHAYDNKLGEIFNYLGLKFLIGINCKKNLKLAFNYLTKGAEIGNINSIENLERYF